MFGKDLGFILYDALVEIERQTGVVRQLANLLRRTGEHIGRPLASGRSELAARIDLLARLPRRTPLLKGLLRNLAGGDLPKSSAGREDKP